MRRQILSLLLLPLLLAGCSTPGTFFKPLQGPYFKAQALPDEDNALVYLYRPQSDWGDQELEAPGVFLNNELIGVLPAFVFDRQHQLLPTHVEEVLRVAVRPEDRYLRLRPRKAGVYEHQPQPGFFR